jgi:hypothetical protein
VNKIVQRLHRAHFDWCVRAIRQTAPLVPGNQEFIALSMVQHRDVLPYLLALKSFARYLRPSHVVLVADPTLTAEDRQLIRHHVPHIVIREAAEFRRPGVPVGGCWERLSAISEYSAQAYVVQLDADTVAIDDPSDVRAAIRDGVSFTLGTEDGQTIGSTREAAALARSRLDGEDQVQALAEAKLDVFDTESRFRYVRGCAGFAGFARGSIDPQMLVHVSTRMGELLGKHWSAWGTEQFTSNLLVASSTGSRVLPHPKYCAPHRRVAATVFLHFIGYVRYTSSYYAATTRRVVNELQSSDRSSSAQAAHVA